MVLRAASLYLLSWWDRAYSYICAMPLPAHFSELLPHTKSLSLLPKTEWKEEVDRALMSLSHCVFSDSLNFDI